MDMMEITDEQRAWIKTRRKRRLRVLAAVLCLSVLFTTYPNILEAFSVFAAENGAEESILYVSGFSDLPEGVREQTVPVGTGLEELTLPDTLEATVQTGQNAADQDEDADRRETEDADEGTEKPSDGEEDGEGAGKPSDEGATGTEDQDGSAENPDGDGQDGAEQETYTVILPEYQSEHVITVKQLEDSSAKNSKTENKNGQADDTDVVTITGVTWQSEPMYDGNTVGTYIFTAILPGGGYLLSEGVSLPQIAVTVSVSENVRLFLERAKALPDLESMIDNAPGEEEEGYEEWETLFLEAISEAEALREMYDAFTETERAQIPEDIYEKLVAWWEYARLTEEAVVYAASGTGWTLDDNGLLTIESDAGMTNWISNGRENEKGNVKQVKYSQ